MNYKDLKDFINSLTEEQLSQPVKVFPRVDPSFEVDAARIQPVDLYYDIWDPERGCQQMEQICDFNENDYRIVIASGSVMLTEESLKA